MQTGKIGVTSENPFPIIKKFLYSDHDIFLREIVSNAIDATQKLRTLALKGAQIIAHPSNLVLPWCQQAMITRSIENRVFSITTNRTGTERNAEKKLTFTGMSQIINPKGEIIKRLNKVEESVYIAEINPEEANDKKATVHNDVLADRRTEMYEL